MAALSGKTQDVQCQHSSHTPVVVIVESNYDITNIHRGPGLFEKSLAFEVIEVFLIKAYHILAISGEAK